MAEENKKDDRRFLANVKTFNGQHGPYQKALMNSLSPTNEDGSPNTYYSGALIWCDVKTGKNYQVKQMAIRNLKNGKTAITIDLESEYEVTPVV